MADSSVLLEVIVEGKNIKLVQREVEELGAAVNRTSMEQEKAATSTNKTTEAQDKQTKSGRDLYNNQRSIINGSLAQGRANAKLASGITSGLVPAYAEIVSNIFAVQQTFAALNRASDLRILRDNLISTGEEAGRNLPIVAESLRDITDAALSTKDALQAVANATAQGFSTTQLEQLTRVAKGASAALGRNLTDSLDRLVRGTAKLEPEILDELGIIVRLDDATREYAAALGKTAGELTQFERQQAFLNAAITQGEKKFGDIANKTDVNPFNQLAASFTDLTQTILEFANTAIAPIAKFFSQNKLALTAAVLLFVQTIGNRLAPTITSLASSAQDALDKASQSALNLAGDLRSKVASNVDIVAKTTKKLPKGFKDVQQAIIDGTASTEELKQGFKSLDRSITIYTNKSNKAGQEDKQRFEQQIADLQAVRQATLDLATDRETLSKIKFDSILFETEKKATTEFKNSLEDLATAEGPLQTLTGLWGGLSAQFSTAFNGITELGEGFDRTKISTSLYNIVTGATKITLDSFRFSAILTGQALLNMIPFIGQILVIFQLLSSVLGGVINFFRRGSEETREIIKSFNQIDDVGIKLAETLREIDDPDSFEATNAILKARVGLLEQLTSALAKTGEVDEDKDAFGFLFFSKSITEAREDLISYRRTMAVLEQELGKVAARNDEVFQQAEQMATIKEQDIEREIRAQKFNAQNALLTVQSYQDRIMGSEVLTKALKNQLPVIEQIKNELLVANDPDTVEKLIRRLEELENKQRSVLASVNGLEQGFRNLSQEAVKLTSGTDTAFTPFIKSIKAVQVEIANITENGEQYSDATKQQLAVLASAFKSTFKEQFKGATTNEEVVKRGLVLFQLEEAKIRTATNLRKRLTKEAKRLGEVSKESAALTRAQIDLENQATQAAIDGETAKLNAIKMAGELEVQRNRQALANIDSEIAKAQEGSLELEGLLLKRQGLETQLAESQNNQRRATAESNATILALQSELTDETQQTLRVEEARIAGEERILKLQKQQSQVLENQRNLILQVINSQLELLASEANTEVTAEDRLAAARAEQALITSQQDARIEQQKETIRLEYALLRAKAAFERARLEQTVAQETSFKFTYTNPVPEIQEVVSDVGKAAQKGLESLDQYDDLLDEGETAAQGLLNTETEVGNVIRANGIKILENQVAREKELATLENINKLQERTAMFVAEQVPFSAALKGLKEQERQLIEDITTLESRKKEGEEDSLALAQKRNELLGVENQIIAENLALDEKRAKAQLDFQSKAITALKKRVKLEQEISSVDRAIKAEKGIEETVLNRIKRERQEREARIEAARIEKDIKMALIDAEFGLLQAKQAFLAAELQKDGLTTEEAALIAANQEVINRQESLNSILKGNIEQEFQLLEKKEALEMLRKANTEIEAAAKETPGGGLLAASAFIGDIFAKPEDRQQDPLEKKFEELFGGKTDGVDKTTEAIVKSTVDQTMQTVQALAKGDELLKTGQQQAMEGNNSLIIAIQSAANQICECIRQANPGSSFTLDNGAGGAGAGVMPGANGMPTSAGTGAAEGTPPDPLATGGYSSEGIDDMINETSGGTATGDGAAAGGEGSPVSSTVQGLMAARMLAQGFAADLKQLGPEGEAMSQFVEGGLALADSVAQIASSGGDMSAILGGVSAAIGAIGQMQQARAKQTIAAIDKEIAAEKKRDGKSKESQQKIAQLEAKKTAVQKKAFEQNKKIQMAQTVINTAAAAMQMMASSPFPLNIALAAMAVAMGMYQLSIIRSQSFDGGAASAGKAETPTIAVGKRSSTVDVAKSKSASGELQYMRGGQGVGNINEFRPAFTGAQYRATGGSTMGYVVGEQGPELFIPETAGTVVPADETEEALAGTPINATFNINAIDASGVAQVLEGQRGNIIGMLRESANSYGDVFFEDVETAIYTDQTRGAERA